MTKPCKSCGLVLPLEAFPVGKLNAGGRRPQCKACYSKYTYSIRNKEVCAKAEAKYNRSEHGRVKRAESSERNKEKRYAATRAWRERNPDKIAAYELKKYDLTIESRARMGNRCAICQADKHICVDHDHKCCPGAKTCGKCVRDVLCVSCNTLIGKLESNPGRLAVIQGYLTMWKAAY